MESRSGFFSWHIGVEVFKSSSREAKDHEPTIEQVFIAAEGGAREGFERRETMTRVKTGLKCAG